MSNLAYYHSNRDITIVYFLITLFLIENNHLIGVYFTGLIGQQKCKGFPPALKFMHLEEVFGNTNGSPWEGGAGQLTKAWGGGGIPQTAVFSFFAWRG